MALESFDPRLPNLHQEEVPVAPEVPHVQVVPSFETELAAREIEDEQWQARLQTAKTAGQIAVVTAEVTPLNEVLRIAALAAAQAKGLDPILVGGVYGGATFAIEAAATYAAAGLLHSERGQRFSEKMANITKKALNKIGITPTEDNFKLSPVTHAGIGLLGGSAPLLMVKNVEDQERTKNQDRKYGLAASAGMAGFCAVQGYLTSKAIEAPDIKTVGAALLAVGGMFALFGPLKKRIKKEEEATLTLVEDAA